MRRTYIFFLLILILEVTAKAQSLTLESPDKNLKVKLLIGGEISYELAYKNKSYITPSKISMSLSNGVILGNQAKLTGAKRTSVNRQLRPLNGISDLVKEKYNELKLQFKGGYSLTLRAYDEGFAYRYGTTFKDSIRVMSETSEFCFNANYPAYFHPALSESEYRLQKISEQLQPNYSSLPVLVKASGLSILIHESDVLDFPCLAIRSDYKRQNTLTGVHSYFPRKTEVGGYSNFGLIVKETEPYLAKTAGSRFFPWRLLAVAENDRDILKNQLVYMLASENKLEDISWIKPGKVAWDWWNTMNLTGVPFKAGINTATYKYFIDFASANHLEYVNLDEGWSDQFDLLKVNKDVDMNELTRYAKEKGVGLILWCVWRTLDRQMMEALYQFQKWGISGVKVDFMDRDDQILVRFHERLLKEAARRKLLVNFHGAYHPNGMSRTYPNQINAEGVKGLEWNKFDSLGTNPVHDVTIPYIRMFAGSMDYTPGAMQNYNRKDWRLIPDRPVSQGTRCHQLAMYIVYYAPLQMLADSPTAYEKEPEYLKFLSSVPTVWSETVPLSGEAGKYVAVARRKGDTWYLGAMTNWDRRELPLLLDFLEPDKKFVAEIFSDGANAERSGNDIRHDIVEVKKGDKLDISMAGGGGWAAIIRPANPDRKL
ncbi:glycoside hydrolase family 97 protein [Arcticibacter tournemirensis]|uniref:Glycoside hydrolase family 97 protein n=1 Tax=Arcticibacter tournemirensis TaxID=699437 RepID=A0A4Q0M6F9_9SPHI|nr:glycoside hydrolase family 97 protein [Arcticibacter tournemirensis]RXF68630.1 glycoside hydrolase family 97 protein [Arcticibacter tournemirensis]